MEALIPTIEIGTTVIQFPDSGNSPNWAQPIIDFATAVQNTLSGLAGPADVFPQIFVIDNFNPGTAVNIPNLTFSTTIVRAAFIRYTVYRNTAAPLTVTESGILNIVYNPTNPTGNLWEYDQSKVGNAQVSFTITDTGQVQLNTTALSGLSHNGKITYAAQALLQN